MDTINKSKYDRKPTSYAANGKIMLCSVIILFIVVFTIACFHSYVHCCFHRHHPRRRRRRLFSHPVVSLTTLLETSLSQITNTKALDPSLLKSLPTFTYSANTTASNSNSHNHINCQVAPLECAVCLSEFEDQEQGRRLPNCNHNFHVDCIDTWFRSQSNCPLCRAPVQPDIPVQKPELSVDIAITINETAGSAHERDEAKKGCSPSTSLSPEEHGKKPLMELVGVSVEEVPNNVINSNNYTSLREIDERLGKGTLGRASKIQNNYNGGFKSSGTQILSLKRIWSI